MAIEWVVEKLISLIPAIDKMSADKKATADEALRAVSHALTETCIYYNSYSKSGIRKEETEAELARYWSAAAIPIRHIDQELSNICEYKSEYWLDPTNWDESKAKGIAIDLETVREKYRAKLN